MTHVKSALAEYFRLCSVSESRGRIAMDFGGENFAGIHGWETVFGLFVTQILSGDVQVFTHVNIATKTPSALHDGAVTYYYSKMLGTPFDHYQR